MSKNVTLPFACVEDAMHLSTVKVTCYLEYSFDNIKTYLDINFLGVIKE